MKKNKKELASMETIEKLITISRRHFTQNGYSKTSLEVITEEAGMTRGALYHHFKNKKMLFLSVLKKVQQEVAENVEKKALDFSDVWEQLIGGCTGFVDAAILEENKRILLIEAPNIIGWDEWRKIDNENSVSHLEEHLIVLQNQKKLVDLEISVICHMISGALNELALYFSQKKEVDKKEIYNSITCLLEGFKSKKD